ncbi:transcriptional regulator [Sphingomonas koreensis]|uniref:Transcriptional regulator n=1 Tax=Sphingomonas koreensis TaxID=93064 RepID=A0A430FYU7_9SPHN|nr:helix-turn-helix transcriptional regulator [Sphingomonas koreensis]RSY78013.1 transcriptional regulator [Sphingomonas koreensis]
MQDGPSISRVAALIGDPARANMLVALMDGRALTVSELAQCAGVALPTASGHLARLSDAGLVVPARQGRHRYFRLDDGDVAAAIELLMGIAERTGAKPVRPGPRDAAMREARVCYDHLAGDRAVRLAERFVADGVVTAGKAPRITESGRARLDTIGVALPAYGRRPECRTCLDWSERRNHLAGALGAAILQHVLAQGWATRGPGRVIAFDAAGAAAFDRAFGL